MDRGKPADLNPTARRRPAAYGGAGWSPRHGSLREELGSVWTECGIDSEWRTLRRVLLHEPGGELAGIASPDDVQMLERPDPGRAVAQHRALAGALQAEGVAVESVAPAGPTTPNQMFVADLFVMTPEGAIVGRPASTVRAGEERHVAARLAALGVPILHTVHGAGTFEGADALWLRPDLLLLGTGFRTNAAGVSQVAAVAARLGARSIVVELAPESMHLMAGLRFLDGRRALMWPSRCPAGLDEVLLDAGYEPLRIPDEGEALESFALNGVTLGPNRFLMPGGAQRTADFLRGLGVDVVEVPVDELARAAGAIGCLTGVLQREKR